MNEKRFREIMEAMQSFRKEKYQRDELLSEMLQLQQEMVALTFNEDHASLGELKLYDVEKHLEQMNENLDNAAREDLDNFIKDSKEFTNQIRGEISGACGENKAFNSLRYLRTPNIILRNVELGDEGKRSELDLVVITSKGLFIIEVKNSHKDIFIDQFGDYYRVGKYNKLDCHIGYKMELREKLLRGVMEDAGIKRVPIKSILVFTDNRIEVQTEYEKIMVRFLSGLSRAIDEESARTILNNEQMNEIAEVIRSSENNKAYSFDFNVDRFKNEFASVMVKLEEAAMKENETEVSKEVEGKTINEESVNDTVGEKKAPNLSVLKYLGTALASSVVTFFVIKGRR